MITYWFSEAETTVIPGAGLPSQPVSVSYFPSSFGHWAAAGAAATPTLKSSSTLNAKKRLNLTLSPFVDSKAALPQADELSISLAPFWGICKGTVRFPSIEG